MKLNADPPLLAVYSITIFLSAALLFLVQPMFARMALPLLGGSPAVWNTAMVFYQGALLAGYAYAHWSTRWLAPRKHAAAHLVLLCLPLLVLPIAIPAGWVSPAQRPPALWLLAMMFLSVGLPFFVVSTSSPILQKWFSATRHPSARDPYFLYAASNAGSLLGLLSYPFIVEPNFALETQSRIWAAGYFLLVLLGAGCAFSVWKSARRHSAAEAFPQGVGTGGNGGPVKLLRRLRWVLLAFVPSSLMLSVTTYITSDLAAVPLLWVIPLSLYLLSYILVFARRRVLPHGFFVRAMPIALVALLLALLIRATEPLLLLAVLHLAVFLVVALVCHGELANDRPDTRHLTEFYLWLSVGGVLGGIFNALVAPVVFTTLLEYPITLVLAALLAARLDLREQRRTELALDLVLPVALGLVTIGIIFGVARLGLVSGPHAAGIIFSVPVVLCYLLSRRPIRFGLGLAMVLVAGQFYIGEQGRVLHAERSFFGLHRVTLDPSGRFHFLVHGKTIHGMQSLDPERRRIPLTYYHPTGPIGQVFEKYVEGLKSPVAVVGLGTGSLASYGRAGQQWDFYEIDPVVARLACDIRYFSFLEEAEADIRIVLGDARISLVAAPEGHYGIIVLDAYSSDSIPMHLMTIEAVELYMSKLAPGGLIAFHVSNLHLDLKPVLANIVRQKGWIGLSQSDIVTLEEEAEGKRPSEWVVAARDLNDMSVLVRAGGWVPLQGEPGGVLWTDRFSSILSVVRWH